MWVWLSDVRSVFLPLLRQSEYLQPPSPSSLALSWFSWFCSPSLCRRKCCCSLTGAQATLSVHKMWFRVRTFVWTSPSCVSESMPTRQAPGVSKDSFASTPPDAAICAYGRMRVYIYASLCRSACEWTSEQASEHRLPLVWIISSATNHRHETFHGTIKRRERGAGGFVLDCARTAHVNAGERVHVRRGIQEIPSSQTICTPTPTDNTFKSKDASFL